MSLWNHQTLLLQPEFASLRPFMLSLPERFARGEGRLIHDGRNKLREIEFEGRLFVVKAFRRPLFINRLVYGIASSRPTTAAATSTRRSCCATSVWARRSPWATSTCAAVCCSTRVISSP